MDFEANIIDIQRQVFEKHGMRTDAHIREGMNVVIFTPEGSPISLENIILQIPYHAILMGNVDIN